MDFFLHQPKGLLAELDQEHASLLEVRLALLTAQTALQRSADERAAKALAQVELHLARLTSVEKATYYYLCGQFSNLAGDPQKAVAQLEQAKSFLVETVDPALTAAIEYELGQILYHQRRFTVALAHYQTAVAQLEGLKEAAPSTQPLGWKIGLAMGNTYLALADVERATSLFMEGIASVQSATAQAEGFLAEALVYGEQGDFARAGLALGRVSQIYEQASDQRLRVEAHNNLAQMLAQNGQWREAEAQAHTALKLAELSGGGGSRPKEASETGPQLKALVTLTNLCQTQARLSEAKDYLTQALGLAEGCNDGDQLGYLYQTAAEVEAASGQREQAKSYYQKALAVAGTTEHSQKLAEIYHSYGQRLREWGEVERAFEYLEKAYRARERSGQAETNLTTVT